MSEITFNEKRKLLQTKPKKRTPEDIKNYQRRKYLENREAMIQRSINRYIKKRDFLNHKIECNVCKSKVNRQNFNQHCSSAKHKKNLNV